jgi:hypothetical protein
MTLKIVDESLDLVGNNHKFWITAALSNNANAAKTCKVKIDILGSCEDYACLTTEPGNCGLTSSTTYEDDYYYTGANPPVFFTSKVQVYPPSCASELKYSCAVNGPRTDLCNP